MPRECGRNVMDGAGDRHGGPGAEERVLVVTGAGSGIGRAVARPVGPRDGRMGVA